MPVPRVADSNAVRKPIRPREGTVNCRRTQPVPWLVMLSMRPLRSASSWVTAPMYSSGTSMVVFSIGSLTTPMVLVTTCGRPTVSSEAFTAHLLGKHGQCEFATALHFPGVRRSVGST